MLEGPFERYHPNGELARRGEYRQGKMHGKIDAFASSGFTPEALRICCVPPGAYRVETEYDDGNRVTAELFYDAEGRRLCSDGSLYPEKPAHLPKEAWLEESDRRWHLGAYGAKGERNGVFRTWSTGGVLLEETSYAKGKLHGTTRLFDEAGVLTEASDFESGERTGRYEKLRVAPGVYADDRIRRERGAFTRELATGIWEYMDEGGTVLLRKNLGPAFAGPAQSSAFDRMARKPRAWLDLASELTRAGRTGEALCAHARAAAGSGQCDDFLRALGDARPALTPEHAMALATHATESAEGDIAVLIHALLRGAEPAAILRAIASSCTEASRASRDFVDAAILLAPERDQCRVTRALIDISLGDPEAAKADAESLGEGYAEQREFLLIYRRIVFTTFDFWPARARFDSILADMPEEPCQPLSTVRKTIQKYATRLALIRGAIVEQMGSAPSWLLPDVTSLLPRGPVVLERRTFELSFDDEVEEETATKPAVEQIAVDETLDLARQDVASLLRLARSDWNALTWLCWSVGLDHVALPDESKPPREFSHAVGMSIERHWRARDRLQTAGLLARTKGIRGFEWEGVDIDDLPAVLAEMAAHEYTDMRALFFFLCDDRQESPWQDNLRKD